MHHDAFIGILILLRFFRGGKRGKSFWLRHCTNDWVWGGCGDAALVRSEFKEMNAFPSLLYRLNEHCTSDWTYFSASTLCGALCGDYGPSRSIDFDRSARGIFQNSLFVIVCPTELVATFP